MVHVPKRYAKASNPYIETPAGPCYPLEVNGQPSTSNYIMYLDAKNLYGWAMSNPLPEKDFEWYEGLAEEEIRNYQEDDVGYFVDCDLGYPHELHDKHNDYPLAPVRTCVTTDMLSPHSKELYRNGL